MFKSLIKLILNIRGDFQDLFFFNEFKELVGKSKGGILGLSVILSLTFIALGFSIGGLQYLDKKMNDPFTNWVNLPISMSTADSIRSIQRDFEDPVLKDSFDLDNIGQYRVEYYGFVPYRSSDFVKRRVRTVNPEEKLLREILSKAKKNVVFGYEYDPDAGEFEFDEACGIIMRQDALLEMGYEDPAKVKQVALVYEDFLEDIVLYVPLVSVVRELPNMADGLITDQFNYLFNDNRSNLLEKVAGNQLRFYTYGLDADSLENEIRNGLLGEPIESVGKEQLEIIEGEFLTETTIFLGNQYEYSILDSIFLDLKTKVPRAQKNLKWECYGDIRDQRPYYLSFNFDDLGKIRSFKDYLSDRYAVEISMTQVESKENFSLVSDLTSFLSTILFAFSLLSIVFYINSMLRTHLEKIKMNLGTLKAFGLNNKFLVTSYVKIIVTFILVAIVIGLGVCLLYTLIEPLVSANKYFNIIDYKILISIVIIILVAIFTTRLTISRTLLKTPGDLIYNR